MKLKNFIALTVIILFYIGISACSKDSTTVDNSQQDANVLRFMTYNIHIANPPSQPSTVVDVDTIAKVIKKVNPHFVTLQEVDRFTDRSGKNLDQAAKLSELTGMHYKFFKAINRSNGEYGLAILSKYPILEFNQVELPFVAGTGAELRTMGWVRVQLDNGQDIIVATTHIDHLEDANRELQTREILKAFKSYHNYPIVLGGDFNMNQSNSIWDLYKIVFNVPCATCPNTHSASKPTTSIDYLLLNNKAAEIFSIKSYQTYLETYASDHLPVVMDLVFQK